MTVTDGESDIAFLSLTDAEFDLSDRGVEGREPAPPIDVFLTTDPGAYRAGETIHATALTRDGTAQAIEGEVLLRAAWGLAACPGYSFGRHDAPFSARLEFLPFGVRTDAAGRALVLVTMPEVENPGRPLEVRVTAHVAEESGRPVERRITQALMPSSAMIGVKPLFEDVVAEGGEARFDILGVGPDLAALPMRVKWSVERIETNFQWYQSYGNWQWEPVTIRSLIASDEIDLGPAPQTISAPVEWGQYEITFTRLDGPHAATSTRLYAGWYAAADTSETPDTLAVSLDKPMYKSRETAQFRIAPRYAGKALVTVVSNHLVDMKAI